MGLLGSRVTLTVALALALGCGGCVRVDRTTVRVTHPDRVGVVSDADNRWLLPPDGAARTVRVFENPVLTASVGRSASGAITYESQHWALGRRVDDTRLLADDGSVTWFASTRASDKLLASLDRGGAVRLHSIVHVNATGPFGLCNGTLFDSCIDTPAVPMSLATDSGNVAEVEVVQSPLRPLGVGEIVFGALLAGAAAGEAAVLLPSHNPGLRAAGAGIGVGVLGLGGLLIANGIWRVAKHEDHLKWRRYP